MDYSMLGHYDPNIDSSERNVVVPTDQDILCELKN